MFHLKVEEGLKMQIKEEMGDIKTHVTYKCLDIEKAVRGESEVTQDKIDDLMEATNADMEELKGDIRGIKREVKSTIIEQLLKPEVFVRVLKEK